MVIGWKMAPLRGGTIEENTAAATAAMETQVMMTSDALLSCKANDM